SRGGHTRFSRDWSSDVCSSDLAMFAFFIKTLAGHYNEILFRSNPVRSFFYQAECNDQIRIQYPLFSTNNRLRMFKDEVNAYWLFIVVLRSEERRVGKDCLSERSLSK